MSHPRVVNVRHKGATWDVYCGRGRCPRTKLLGGLGNPYSVQEHGREAMRMFLEDLNGVRLTNPEVYQRILNDVRPPRVLGCWCAPRPCHAEVYARLADGEEFHVVFWSTLRTCGLLRPWCGNEGLTCRFQPSELCERHAGIMQELADPEQRDKIIRESVRDLLDTYGVARIEEGE